MTSKPSSRLEARRQRLLGVLCTLETGYPVPSGRMRSALTAREFRDYSEELDVLWPQPQGWEKEVFTLFKRLVREGDFYESRARKLPCVGMPAMKRRVLMRQAQRSYNGAIEKATELLRVDPRLAHLFDREINEGIADEMEAIVRPKGSAHEFAHAVSPSELLTRAAIQRCHARGSLDALDARLVERVDFTCNSSLWPGRFGG